MTLPTTQPINGTDDDSDMFGPPRSSPPIGYHHHRSKVPMISPKLRQREERKRILQLCAHKLERIKDSEANLRRSVCINNTYSRLTDELRREKQNRYLANLPKSETKPEAAHDNTFSSYKSSNITSSTNTISSTNNSLQHQNDPMEMYPSSTIQNYHNLHYQQQQQHQSSISSPSSTTCLTTSVHSTAKPTIPSISNNLNNNNNSNLSSNLNHNSNSNYNNNNSITSIASSCLLNNSNLISHSTILSSSISKDCALISSYSHTSTISTTTTTFTCHGSTTTTICDRNNKDNIISTTQQQNRNRFQSCHSRNSVDTDLEILDRELSAIDATMPLTDPEITQGAEHLEKAVSSRKRLRSEDENDRLVREALSHFYLPPTQRLISAIDDCPLDIKRQKINNQNNNCINNMLGVGTTMLTNCNNNLITNDLDLDLALDLNPNQKDFEVIMDALRLGTPSPTQNCGNDSCGQAAMMSESGNTGGIFNNLVVTSLET